MWRQGVISDAVAAADVGFGHELAVADGAVVQERAHESVHRVATVVLGHRQDAARLLGGFDDAPTAPDGERQRLFAQGIQAQFEQLGGGPMVRAGVGRAVGGFEAVHFADHRFGIAVDARPFAEQFVGLVGQILGVLTVQIAHGDEVEVHMRGAR